MLKVVNTTLIQFTRQHHGAMKVLLHLFSSLSEFFPVKYFPWNAKLSFSFIKKNISAFTLLFKESLGALFIRAWAYWCSSLPNPACSVILVPPLHHTTENTNLQQLHPSCSPSAGLINAINHSGARPAFLHQFTDYACALKGAYMKNNQRKISI